MKRKTMWHQLKETSATLIIGLLCLLLNLTPVSADQLRSINVVSEAWDDATNKDGTGLYWDIIRLVYEPIGIQVNLSTTAYARSVGLVKNHKQDAWVGSYLNEEEGIIYPESHFDADVVSALFIDKPAVPWQGEKSLEGKIVGWIKGYELHEYLEVEFSKKEFSNRKNVVYLLKSDLLDYYIDAQAELDDYFGPLIEDKTLRSEKIKLLNLYLGFANNERGKQLSEVFDQRFRKLLAAGEIKKLFDKWDYEYIW